MKYAKKYSLQIGLQSYYLNKGMSDEISSYFLVKKVNPCSGAIRRTEQILPTFKPELAL